MFVILNILVFSLMLLIGFLNYEFKSNDMAVIISFCVNYIIIMTNIFVGINNLQINLIHWIFLLIFMNIAPFVQYVSDIVPWGGSFDSYDYIFSNLLIFIWILSYIIGYRNIRNKEISICYSRELVLNNRTMIILLALSVFSSCYFIEKVGFVNLMFRSTSHGIGYSPFDMIQAYVYRSIVFISLAASLLFGRKNFTTRIFKIIFFICLLIVSFPLGVPRFYAGAVYFALVLIFFYKRVSRIKVIYLFLFGIIFIFPLLNIARFLTVSRFGFGNYELNVIRYDMFFEGHYDAYSMLMRSLKYTMSYNYCFGEQLMGSLLFFVPRNVWNSKPVASGSEIAHKLGMSFDNISCPIIGEGWLDFGVLGVVIYGLLFGYLLKQMDNRYLRLSKSDKKDMFLIIYFFLCGFIFFLMRGALLISVSFFSSFMFAYLIINKIIVVFGDRK